MASKGTALVTGAARGIGRAIALRLADDGFDVAVNDISNNSGALDELVNEINAKGRTSSAHVANVKLEDQVRGMIDQVVKTHGSLEVMVANAGVAGNIQMSAMTSADWDHVMETNARGTFLCYKHAGLQMIKQGNGGRIIGASSVYGKQGHEYNLAYTASKFAIRGLTQAAALELGRHGITVNAYAPGAIDTDLLVEAATNEFPRDSVLSYFAQKSPLGVVGSPSDVANLVSFIASKESKFVTGQSLSVNGGMFFD
ncbi:hypothetical protein DFH09DRAFT_1159326 [Mycena vulgaris]|nr:hypothetical protein DFH09DRAFT_1159326 [Mycena vulgaris]